MIISNPASQTRAPKPKERLWRIGQPKRRQGTVSLRRESWLPVSRGPSPIGVVSAWQARLADCVWLPGRFGMIVKARSKHVAASAGRPAPARMPPGIQSVSEVRVDVQRLVELENGVGEPSPIRHDLAEVIMGMAHGRIDVARPFSEMHGGIIQASESGQVFAQMELETSAASSGLMAARRKLRKCVTASCARPLCASASPNPE